MYAEFFGLRELPFNITPDPRFLYMNDCYQEALAALGYGIEARKGFISLIGDAGTGKTTLLRRLLDTVGPMTRTVLLLNPTVGFDEILEHILLELGIPLEGGRKLVHLQRLNEFLLEHTAAGGNVALLVDEAQDMRPEVLEELRLLSNLETAREKILQIVLAGQPELDDTLANTSLRQLRQRVALRIRLHPLSPADVAAYARTRLQRVGGPEADLFTPGAFERIAALSHGIPRLINVLCDASLLAAFAAGSRTVTPAIVEDAWRDHDSRVPGTPAPPSEPIVAAAPVAEVEPVVATPGPPAEAPEAATTPSPLAEDDPPRADAAPETPPQPATPDAEVLSLPARRPPFSVPTAAALVVAMTFGLYVTSIRRHPLPVAEPEQSASAASPQELAFAPEPARPPAMAGLAPSEAAASEPEPGARAVAADDPLSAAEAAALVEEFRTAYEARDVSRLTQLFAEDAEQNGVHGIDAIAAGYRTSLPTLSGVRYAMPSLAVKGAGPRADVRGLFVISYQTAQGERGQIRGRAEWALERRAGRTRILSLNYRLKPTT